MQALGLHKCYFQALERRKNALQEGEGGQSTCVGENSWLGVQLALLYLTHDPSKTVKETNCELHLLSLHPLGCDPPPGSPGSFIAPQPLAGWPVPSCFQ